MSKRTIGVLLIAVVALGAMTGVAAAESGLNVTVDETAGEPVVTVTHNDSAVENATVNVTVVDPANESYAGTGEYTTDENGTVTLEAAEEDVTIEVTVEHENETASTIADLEAPGTLAVDVTNTDGEPLVTVTDGDDAVENASVNVTTADGQNVTYVGEGSYTTDENGTVTLPAATENVTIDVTAEYEGETATATVDLIASGDATEDEDTAEGDQPFGQLVREFIESLSEREGGIGAAVSDFVTENNPGNAPDHAGNPGGPSDGNATDAGNESDTPGNAPDHAGQGNDGEQGPPDHAGQGNGNETAGQGNGNGAGTGAGNGGDNAGQGNGNSNGNSGGNGAGNGNGNSGNGNSAGNGNGGGNGGPP